MKKLIVAAIAAVMMLIGTNASAQYTAFFGYAHNGFGGSELYDDIDFHGICGIAERYSVVKDFESSPMLIRLMTIAF